MNKPILFLVLLTFTSIVRAEDYTNWVAVHKSKDYDGWFFRVLQADPNRNYIKVDVFYPEHKKKMGSIAQKDTDMRNWSFMVKPFPGMSKNQFLFVINNTPMMKVVSQTPNSIIIDTTAYDAEYKSIDQPQTNTQPASYSGNIDQWGNVRLYADNNGQNQPITEIHKIVTTTVETMEVPLNNNVVMAPKVLDKKVSNEKDMGVIKWSQDLSRDMQNHQRKGWDSLPKLPF